MPYLKLKYNLVRMWGKHGLGEMFCNDNDVYCFKFKHEEGMHFVLENSLWMVTGRPLIPEVCLDKPEPDKVPLWVKMFDIPLEAWSHKGISKLASSIGKPLIMDEMTTNMCQFGRGRIGFARVLIEVDAKKPFKDRIDVQYRDKSRNIIRTKHIRIEYSWKPTVCDFCSVFGHSTKMCSKRPKTKEEKEQQSKIWLGLKGIRMDIHNDEGSGRNVNAEKKNELDYFVQQKLQPTPFETSKWSLEMREMISFINNLMMELNTINNLNMELKLASWSIRGMGTVDKQDEIQILILENNLSIIAILETRAKGKEIDRICSRIFNRWNWSTNMNNCNKGCRIVVGWDTNVIDIHVLISSWQVMFCLVETVQEKIKFLCSFVYAANNGKDRVELWKDLALQKQIINGRPWVLLGDFNVTLHAYEHSAGSSVITQDMQDFKDCVSNNELEDICSSGFQYTWTKSTKNPKGGILKKLDRAMSNDKFIIDYEHARAVFLPCIISDHCPYLITIPNGLKKNVKTFRFINYIADKPEFIPIVKEEWKLNVKGFQMYRLPMDEDDLMFIKKLDVVEASNMIKDITDKEIQEAIFDNDNDKALGPDGYTSCFFKKAWNVVGMDVCLVVKEFFQTGKLLKKMNATIISLIPMLDTPNKVSDFRPIAYCNVLYKCISKVLTNRIKSELEKNIKADGRFKYHAGCKDLQMTHLCFADDLMVFCNGDVHSITVVKKSLNEFSRVSGLFPNLKKSTIFFGSVNDQVKQEILKIVDFSIGKLLMRYLGVSLLAKCLSVNDCRQLIDKVKERIGDWKNRFLSYAGRLQLISSVLASIQTYWASVYLIPKTVAKEIDKVMKNFLWSHGCSNGGKAKIAWKVVCRPNDQGGLGIKPLRELNEILLMIHIWKIVEQKQNLWVQCYSKKVWSNIKAMINLDQIGVDACVYMIWNERNSRTFSKGSREEETLTKIVKDEIRWKLASLNVKRTAAVKKVFDEWGVNPSYCQDH
nr:hypothetical protein [Tanacetum cinerariifolium]